MWFHSLLATWKSGFSRRLRPQPRPARRGSFRPRLEALEDRWVPATLNVTSSADTGAVGTLRWAVGVADANPGDTIDILTTQPIVLTQGQLLLSQSTTVEATAGRATISGDGLSRVFEVGPGASVTLNNLNITGGNAAAGINQLDPTDGGGILACGPSNLTLTNCTLSGNSAARDGGAIGTIYTGGTVTLTNCTLSGNSAAGGGGAIDAYSTVTVTNCTLSGNSAKYGGAIDADGYAPTLTVTNSTLSGNSATLEGGAIYINGVHPALQVNECMFSGNSAKYGGAIASPSYRPFIANSTFSGNTPTSLWTGNGGAQAFGFGDTGLPPGAVVSPINYWIDL
jgi:predicted outer membrane repeat protein